MAVDCDDTNPAISPNAFETLGNDVDDNCAGGDFMRLWYAESSFLVLTWPGTGAVDRLPDGVRVGRTTVASPASVARNLSIARQYGGTGMRLDVTAASGALCTAALTVGPFGGPGPNVTHTRPIPGAGVQWLDFSSAAVPYSLKKIEIACPANESVTLDWLTLQDAEEIFPAPRDLVLDWHDTRTPGGGYTTALVREDTLHYLYMGSDVAGVARYDVTTNGPWQTMNGTGTSTFFPGGPIGIVDILPMEDGSDVVYALVGDVDSNGPSGGFWYSPDAAVTWQQLGSSWDEPWDTTDLPENGTQDDLSGYGLLTQCPGSHYGIDPDVRVAWAPGGGRHLQGESTIPTAGDVIYIGNGDVDALGVSIWDGSEVCALPNSGTALPAEPIGGILRVDVHPNDTPVLLVGYRGRLDGTGALYVCELPSTGVTCAAGTASCWEVPAGTDSPMGVDVRDLQLDQWSDYDNETGILVADGGNRPVDTNLDGVGGKGDTDCTAADTGVDELYLDDSLGFVDVTDYVRLSDAGDVDQTVAGTFSITGLAMDGSNTWVFANVPASAGSRYAVDRLYRVEAADLQSGLPA